MLVSRFVRKDLGPNAYLGASLRVILAVVAVIIVEQAVHALKLKLDEPKELVIAFGVGAFPVVVWQFLTAITKKIPGIPWALPNLKRGIGLSELDGLTIWHETRLEEEDIQNAANMATADIVDLLLSTRLPPHRIIEWVDQSILLSAVSALDDEHTKSCRGILQAVGIRSATGLRRLKSVYKFPATLKVDLGKELSFEMNEWLRLLDEAVQNYPNLTVVHNWKRFVDFQSETYTKIGASPQA
jgi:hypothetical protein